jgi:hypothetical protein
MLEYMNGINKHDELASISRPVLVLGGYSYGSMIAAHLPAVEAVAKLLQEVEEGSARNEITQRAQDVSRDAGTYFAMHAKKAQRASLSGEDQSSPRRAKPGVIMGGSDSEHRRVSRENSRKSFDGEKIRQSLDKIRRKVSSPHSPSRLSSTVSIVPETTSSVSPHAQDNLLIPEIAYLIVSPILSIAAGLTTMFSKLKFEHDSLAKPAIAEDEYAQLLKHPCCCIYGSRDSFTSARRLKRWTSDLKLKSECTIRVTEVEDGHFWADLEGRHRLKSAIAGFLDTLSADKVVETQAAGDQVPYEDPKS